MDRRSFVGRGAVGLAALSLPTQALADADGGSYGDLVPDPGGLLDLPRGFQYRVVSEEGRPVMRNRSSSGIPVPGDFDGMAAYDGPCSRRAGTPSSSTSRVPGSRTRFGARSHGRTGAPSV
jgi:hypothetical protein